MADALLDWLVVGTPKSGTTTIAHWLGAHPDCQLTNNKEVAYFDELYSEGPAAVEWNFEPTPRRLLRGTSNPTAFYRPEALERIARDIPDARLILVLREPVSRFWSQYWFLHTMGFEPRKFDEVYADELADPMRPRPGMPHGHLAYGYYGQLLERFESIVGLDRLLILFLDDMQADPMGAYAQICRHVGVEPQAELPYEGKTHNAARGVRSARLTNVIVGIGDHTSNASRFGRGVRALLWKVQEWNWIDKPVPPMPEQVREELREHYAPELERLRRYVDHLPAAWGSAPSDGS